MSKTHQHPLVVITGASAGIGAATARRFAKENYRLALTARRKDKLQDLQKELQTETSIFELDVQDSDAVVSTMAHIEEQHGPIHILVNNAGCALGLESAYEGKLEEWEQMIDTNIKGILYCTRAVLPSMVKHNAGHIINLGSIAGRYPYPGGNVYGATKAFVHQFTLNLRADLLGTKVRASCIEPGLTGGTEFSSVRYHGDQEKVDKTYKNAHVLQPEDIAEVIYFCCSLPAHVNINTLEMMPVSQASGPLAIHRS